MINNYLAKVLATSPLELWTLGDTVGNIANAQVNVARRGQYNAPSLGHPGIGDGGVSAKFNTGYANIYSSSLAAAFSPTLGSMMVWGRVVDASVWANAAFDMLMSLSVDSNNAIRLQKSSTANTLVATYIAGGTNKNRNFVAGPTTGYFQYVITWNKAADRVRVYLNGVQQGADLTGLGVWVGSLTSNNCAIGASGTGVSNPWHGYCAYGAIWTTELTAAQVLSLATVDTPTYPPKRNYSTGEYDQYITPDGLTFDFADYKVRFLTTGFNNQGMAPIEYKTQRGPVQHGESVVAYTLRPRQVQAVFRWNGRDRFEHWEHRSELLNLLRPNRGPVGQAPSPGILRKYLPDGAKRDLYVYISNSPNFSPAQDEKWDEFAVKDVIRFVAYDPLFYDPTLFTVEPGILVGTGLVFPITFPIFFGVGVFTGSVDITYTGTFLSYPKIILTGPLNNPYITNGATGETIQLNYTIPSAVDVTIDLQYGAKFVFDSLGNNLIRTVSPDSDLGTFHIAPDPEAPGGVNSMTVGADGADGNSKVVIQYFRRFIGI